MKYSRRLFLKSSSITLAGMPFLSLREPTTKRSKIKVGLIGCGGRGTGAAAQALAADPNVVITALADVFEEQLLTALNLLSTKDRDRIDVPTKRQFLGFDSYKKLMLTDVDVVLLCSPPNFRPDHLEFAVQQGKHIFCEKPVAVDIPGVHRVMEAVKLAKDKKLNLVSGFCFRYLTPNREIVQRIHDGAVGAIKSITTFRFGGELTLRPRISESTDLQHQLRNWYYFQRYSGDLIVEQSVHSVDYMNWIMNNELPLSVNGTGGRQNRPWDNSGNTFDHFAVEYAYANGVKGMHFARQQNGTDSRNSVEVMGAKGFVDINISNNYNIISDTPYSYQDKANNMYQTQHDELFEAIRNKAVIDDGAHMVNSTLLAIWGKLSAYTGKRISYEEIMTSTEVLGPHSDAYSWEMAPDEMAVAQPGKKVFV